MAAKGASDSVAMLLFFVFWYAGNMKYNEYNTAALGAVGGKTSGLTMTVATMQLGVCAIYAIIMWAVKLNPAKLFGLQMPEKQNFPQVTTADLIKSIPLAFCAAGAHAATVFALVVILYLYRLSNLPSQWLRPSLEPSSTIKRLPSTRYAAYPLSLEE